MNNVNINEFRKSMRQLERLLEKQSKNFDCCCGVSVAQCHTLLALEEMEPCSLSVLAKELELDKSTVSRSIEGLVRIGLVHRKLDLENRRYTIQTLSEQGRLTVKKINEENNEFYNEMLNKLANKDKNSLILGLTNLIDLLQKTIINSDKCRSKG
ncbi:winged helix-turn-helix transcriptional regulator [bacterium]|nr:winged helix-turn-helix transcriptional regulator [bacterium]